MKVTVSYDVLGDTADATHTGERVTVRLRDSGVATVREYENNRLVRSTHYRSVWIITRTDTSD